MSTYQILTNERVRLARAPTNILDRAVQYASSRSIRAIWIDQECIDQDDTADKAMHIQAMDAIYRAAQEVVDVLNQPVVTGEEVKMLTRRFTRVETRQELEKDTKDLGKDFKESEKDLKKLRSEKGRLRRFAEHTLSDQWYSRAWTYQESIVASSTLHLLLPCEQSIPKPSWMGQMPTQLVLDQWTLRILSGGYPEACTHLEQSWLTCRDYKSHIMSHTETKADMTTHRLGSLSPYETLHDRGLSDPVDKITLIANLCRYEIRLDVLAMPSEWPDINLSIWVQALLNGDISLLLTVERPSLVRQSKGCKPPDSLACVFGKKYLDMMS